MLILASQSPRRQQLLAQVGIPFQVEPSGAEDRVDVSALPPAERARTLALTKAREVARRHPEAVVLGADTVVVVDGQVLGKPRDPDHARAMLRQLAARDHLVITGVALVQAATGREVVAHETTRVWIRPLTPEQIEWYVRSGEPLDKAGAYGIQGLAAALVERIDGCYYNVVGLPLSRVIRLLEEEFGIPVLR
ncbi:MAG: Maf family protein [Bacillota bacterium]|nr:MAG: septum formation inhibitor Maf [Bacillota bacterium]